MSEILLFHHAQGLTPGVRAFAATLTRAGHRVHLPDLFDGRTFDDLAAGVAHAEQIGMDRIIARGQQAAEPLPADLVYAGFSLGVLPAQMLTQTRPGARGALFVDACVPLDAFPAPWPAHVPVQIHAMEADTWFTGGGDLEAAQALVASVGSADRAALFLYPGDRHLFADSSLPSYDAATARLFEQRALDFLAGLPSKP